MTDHTCKQPRSICNGHIAVFLKLRVVALGLLWNTVSEEATGEALILVLNRKYFVETAEILKLVQPTFFNLPGELLAPQLVPKESGLLVHFLELPVPHDSVKIFLTKDFIDAQKRKRVFNNSLFDLLIQGTIGLERRSLIHF